jgi:hypothetical protein
MEPPIQAYLSTLVRLPDVATPCGQGPGVAVCPRTYYEPSWTSPPENVQRHSCAPPRCQKMVQAQTGESSARSRTSCLVVCSSLCTSRWKEILIVYDVL